MIKSSTGKTKNNKPENIVILQLLLNKVCIYRKKDKTTDKYDFSMSSGDAEGFSALPNLTIDGKSDALLAVRIEAYQAAKKMKTVDGWISPRGNTIKTLMDDAGVVKGTKRMSFIRKEIKTTLGVSAVKAITVTTLYGKQYKQLSCEDKEGLEYILTTAKSDKDVTRITELAYMLATTKHETAHTFRAICEFGKGSGRSYGKDITVTHTNAAKKSTTYKNKYYGRGYVQLTWGYNYQRVDEKLGNGTYPNKNKTKASEYNKGFTISNTTKSIYLNPDKALDKENAYVAMVYGMQKGIFTGKKITNYVSNEKVDYFNARRVINGTDKAQAIADYAETLEILLLLSTR